MNYKIILSKQAFKDIKNLKAAKLDSKAKRLIEIIANNPYQTPPPCEKLIGDLSGMYSRRINLQHRLVYTVNEEEKYIKILRMWKHYEL